MAGGCCLHIKCMSERVPDLSSPPVAACEHRPSHPLQVRVPAPSSPPVALPFGSTGRRRGEREVPLKKTVQRL